VIAKANKNFLCYCLVRVLKMLYENVNGDHLEGLEAIMILCDASILDDIPEEIVKLSGCIVKRWWTSHGLPYVTDVFRVIPEVRVVATCCDAWRLLILTSISYVLI
jgi:hypothetical protein